MFVSSPSFSLIKPIIILSTIVLLHELCEYFKELGANLILLLI